jgi:Flp pilus assembly protein TadB
MSENKTGRGSTAASSAVLRAGAGRTPSRRAQPEGTRLATLRNPTQTADSNRPHKSMTAHTTILVCWLILLIVALVALELHIRNLTRHTALSQPQIPSALSAVRRSTSGSPIAACLE